MFSSVDVSDAKKWLSSISSSLKAAQKQEDKRIASGAHRFLASIVPSDELKYLELCFAAQHFNPDSVQSRRIYLKFCKLSPDVQAFVGKLTGIKIAEYLPFVYKDWVNAASKKLAEDFIRYGVCDYENLIRHNDKDFGFGGNKGLCDFSFDKFYALGIHNYRIDGIKKEAKDFDERMLNLLVGIKGYDGGLPFKDVKQLVNYIDGKSNISRLAWYYDFAAVRYVSNYSRDKSNRENNRLDFWDGDLNFFNDKLPLHNWAFFDMDKCETFEDLYYLAMLEMFKAYYPHD